jgi:hypothetical protein
MGSESARFKNESQIAKMRAAIDPKDSVEAAIAALSV